jgi:hypothetical protein
MPNVANRIWDNTEILPFEIHFKKKIKLNLTSIFIRMPIIR